MEQNVFDQLAKRYDTEERLELAKVIVNAVQSELQYSRSKSLLDYGGGTGLVSLALAKLVDSVLLVDSAQPMLEVAKAKIDRFNISNATVLYADFTQETPLLKADIVLLSLVLLHIPDTDHILTTLFHMLNDGGKLIIVDFDKNDRVSHPKIHSGFSQKDLREKLTKIGFTAIEIQTFHYGKNIFAKQDASMFIASGIKNSQLS